MQAEICAKRDIFAPERPASPELLSHEFNPPRSIRHTQITTLAMPTSNRTHRAEFLQASATLERNNERHSKWSSDAVNIYRRIKGQVQWQLIAVRKRRFPFFDESDLAVPNTPEVREYMAIGVVNDEEIGQMSEIKEVVYAG